MTDCHQPRNPFRSLVATTHDWIVFDLIGVLAAPPWHDLATRPAEAWDAFKLGQQSEDGFWSPNECRAYRNILSFRHDRLALLHGLKERGVKVAVAANFARAWLDHLLRKIGEPDLFDARIISQEVRVAKPHEQFWAKVLEHAPAGSIVVDDRRENCQAATRAGFRSVWAHPVCNLEREIERLLAESRQGSAAVQ